MCRTDRQTDERRDGQNYDIQDRASTAASRDKNRLVAGLCAPSDPVDGFKGWAPGDGKKGRERMEGREEGMMETPIFETWLRP